MRKAEEMDVPGKVSEAQRFLAALERHPICDFIGNLDTMVTMDPTGATNRPMTRNDGNPTCYICSPSVAYVDYAAEELRNFSAAPLLKKVLELLIGAARPLVAATGLDRQIQPNNWLLSTNIRPDIDAHVLRDMTLRLAREHPTHAIVWRSLNDGSDADLLLQFRQAGYRLVPARQVYLYDCRQQLPPIRRDMKNDLKLLTRSELRFSGPESLTDDDFGRIAELYAALYIGKYTALNPRYTPLFMAAMHRQGILELHTIRDMAGVIQGVIGFFAMNGVLTAPVVGYDTAKPQDLGLYRLLVVFGMLEARRRRMLYNMSAGAALFKRTRGAIPAIEYTAIYNRHLPLARRAPARLMEILLASIGVPLMKRFEL